jgi:Aspartyl/Asparaginyl beta-hydroxylase
MRQDLEALAAPLMDIERVGKSHERVGAEVAMRVEAGEPFGWVRGWGRVGGNPDWTQYGLVLGDRANRYASAPHTLPLLAPLRGIKVAAFVRLAPGTLLPLHTHPEVAAEGLLQMHVTLKAPTPSASCLLNVAGEVRQHVTGSALVFDGLAAPLGGKRLHGGPGDSIPRIPPRHPPPTPRRRVLDHNVGLR